MPSLVESATRLWKRSPPWRILTGSAGLVTVLAIVASIQHAPRQSTQTSGGGGQTAANTPTTPASASTGCIKPQSKLAPMVSGSGSNVRPVGGGGSVGQSSWERVMRFSSEADGAKALVREGPRCEALTKALQQLQAPDFGFSAANCGSDVKDKIEAARRCAEKLTRSDARFETVDVRYREWSANPSAGQLLALAEAAKQLSGPFDKTRDRWINLDAGKRLKLKNATQELADSDRRIAELNKAITTTSGGPSVTQSRALAGAAQAITGLDKARLIGKQLAAVEAGLELAGRLGESETRFAELRAALRAARGRSDEAERARLIDAMTRLTAFDRRFADARQQEELKQAQRVASGFSVARLVEITRHIDPAQADPGQLAELKNLRDIIEANGGIDGATQEQSSALREAETASALLQDSDARIDALESVAQRWAQGPDLAMSREVRAALDRLTELDRQRMTRVQQSALEVVESARVVIEASELGVLERQTSGRVPVFVTVDTTSGYSAQAREMLRNRLESEGLRVVRTEDSSAIVFSLDVATPVHRSTRVGSLTISGTSITVGLRAVWRLTGQEILSTRESGVAKGGADREARTREALEQAVDGLFRRFDERIQDG